MQRLAFLWAVMVALPGLALAQPGPARPRQVGAGNQVEAARPAARPRPAGTSASRATAAPPRQATNRVRPGRQDIEVENDETHRGPRR